MKRNWALSIAGIALFSLAFTSVSSLNFMVKSTQEIQGYMLTDHYYTLNNNINNSASAAYIAPKPLLNAIEQAALTLPSDSFTVAKNQQVLLTIKLVMAPQKAFIINNLTTGQQQTIDCNLKGDITANRAIEIVSNNYEKNKASLVDSYLYFNHKKIPVIENAAIQAEVMKLAEAEIK
ncbi:hypothetical protein HH214_03320 [Mucilaginibacter robiniae]|uniref:Uncharacterized protein n=1 Tax=Mucilaginibacter robiniae TaxID=2728022 RepID=A0A7L5DXN6_9SPHI|nr:hypothetical protein [Mucilaginibacter robiniae]QJD94978.1 hypothetical protein HH214_03320 [Mucilaginibacter robiniae]